MTKPIIDHYGQYITHPKPFTVVWNVNAPSGVLDEDYCLVEYDWYATREAATAELQAQVEELLDVLETNVFTAYMGLKDIEENSPYSHLKIRLLDIKNLSNKILNKHQQDKG